jgi:thiamine pyrophosphate-dependent acetolactate synthase large subunit-like protein
MAENRDPRAVSYSKEYDRENTIYESGRNQPRDARGKFRVVLARIKENLAAAGLEASLAKAEEIEKLNEAGSLKAATKAADQLRSVLTRLDTGALNADSLENVRETARLLGLVISNALGGTGVFGSDANKMRFSDLPQPLKDLMDEMITRVEKKIGQEDADDVTQKLRTFKAGGDYLNQQEVSSEMSTLLRLLT